MTESSSSSNESSSHRRSLTPNQWRLVGAAAALVSITIIAYFLLGVFNILKTFVATFSGVLWPLAVAGVMALILKPFVVILQRRLNFSRTWSIITVYAVILLIAASMVLMVVPRLVEQTVSFIEYLPELIVQIKTAFTENYPKVVDYISQKIGEDNLTSIRESITNSATALLKSSQPAIATLGSWIGKVIAIGTGLAIIPVYLFFMLESRSSLIGSLKEQLSFIPESRRDDILFLIKEFIGSIVSFFRGQIVIAFIMGILLALGFAIIGLKFAIILGLMIGFLNIIPYLGSIIGLGIALPMAYFQKESGGLNLLLLSIAVFAAVQVIEGYLLTPRIMGKSTGLHPMVIIVAIFFWGTALDGLLGMILAIPLTAFFVVAWRLAKRKYLDHKMLPGSEAKA